MAKWTKSNNPHTWGKRKKSKKSTKKSTKKSKTTTRKKGHKTMAKKRRKSNRRRGGHRRGGHSLLSLSKRDAMYALAACAGYGFLEHKAEDSQPDEMKWFKESMPVVTAIGRAGTIAVGAGLLAAGGVARKFTKPLAVGVGFVALVNLARRGFKTYETEDEARAIMSGPADNGEQTYLAGDVDLSREYIEAEGVERAA